MFSGWPYSQPELVARCSMIATAPIEEELFPCLKARGCSLKRSPENGPLQRTARRRGWVITLEAKVRILRAFSLTLGASQEAENKLRKATGGDDQHENDALKLD